MKITLKSTCLKSDGRRSETECWNQWMKSAAKLATRFYLEVGKDDPFMYGEQASVGFLATAAAHAGMMALPEFAISKGGISERDSPRTGRADLWLSTEHREWYFEAKQKFVNRRSYADLQRYWLSAERCARDVSSNGTAVAMLILSCWRLKGSDAPAAKDTKRAIETTREEARAAISEFVERRQFAWRIGTTDSDLPETYIIMDIIRN